MANPNHPEVLTRGWTTGALFSRFDEDLKVLQDLQLRDAERGSPQMSMFRLYKIWPPEEAGILDTLTSWGKVLSAVNTQNGCTHNVSRQYVQ